MEKGFSKRGEVHIADRDFPCAALAAGDGGAEGAADDLVAVADADEADAGVGENGLGEGDEFEDPGGGIEGVVSWGERGKRRSASWGGECQLGGYELRSRGYERLGGGDIERQDDITGSGERRIVTMLTAPCDQNCVDIVWFRILHFGDDIPFGDVQAFPWTFYRLQGSIQQCLEDITIGAMFLLDARQWSVGFEDCDSGVAWAHVA